ncbi:MAG: mannosyl-3-phosphoglycerate phosphatase [Nanoarchaeota archaeon]|nr:mannosyl-3-phosphoglycerate phosphatase [Nanoarchaeota archaeon]
MKQIIFTDLDGTLLDYNTYSFKKAQDALRLLNIKKIPLIICTSKTRAEIEYYRKKLGNRVPFISENGGAIFIPKNYFKFQFSFSKTDKNYFIIELGTDYNKLISVIKKIKKSNINIGNFSDMSAKEVSKITNLSVRNAKLAKKRNYDEPFLLYDKKKEKDLIKIIKKNKLNYTKGTRFYHLMGNFDKGKAVKILINLFKRKYNKITTYGFGDSKNDFEMLNSIDNAYLVMKKNKKYASKKYKKADGVGPIGWSKVVNEEILNN